MPCHGHIRIPSIGRAIVAAKCSAMFAVLALAEEKKEPPEPPPIRAILVTGGSSHDHASRSEVLTRGIGERLSRPVDWVVHGRELDGGDARHPLFDSAKWAEACDIVVYDFCLPRVRDPELIARILAPHRAGLPAVLVHGSLISFLGADEWSEFTGATIRRHEGAAAVRVETAGSGGPVTLAGLPRSFAGEELYLVEKSVAGLQPIATAVDTAGDSHPLLWTRRYGPSSARIFASTLGNAPTTLRHPPFLDTLARGFLWALDLPLDEGFIAVSAGDSLKGLDPPPARAPLRIGWNEIADSEASAFTWGEAKGAPTASLALDGDSATAWHSEGPGVWRVALDPPRDLAALAILWEGRAPAEALLEASVDGRSWRTLASWSDAESTEGEVGGKGAEDRTLFSFDPCELAQIRLSIPRPPSGGGFGLREVAAYVATGDIPAAILLQGEAPLPRLRVAGAEGLKRRIHLEPEWRVAAAVSLPGSGAPKQIVPTASGGIFVSLFPESPEEEKGKVLRLDHDGKGGLVGRNYLDRLAPDTLVAWDGEWLHLLSGGRLERVRRALGEGPADERRETGLVFTAATGEEEPAFTLTDLQWDDGAWLRAGVESGAGARLLDAAGRAWELPRHGSVRFRRDGSGCRVSRSPDDDASLSPNFGRIEGDSLRALDGERIWIAAREGDALEIVCLVTADDRLEPGPDWNEIDTGRLFDYLDDSRRPSVRREAALEILRRKRTPIAELTRRLAADPPPTAAAGLVTVVAGLESGRALDWLVRLAQTPQSALQVPAFLALGDHPAAVDHPVFAELGRSTVPAVSASILKALRRSHSRLPGAETVALALSSHPDPGLAAEARQFLLAQDSLASAWSALDDPEQRGEWPVALEWIVERHSSEAVEGLIRRAASTGDPGLRTLLLESLCRLYFDEGLDSRPWEATERIDRHLRAALVDPRVDQTALLAAMERDGLPRVDAETLVRLANESLPLESYVLGELEGEPGALPTAVRDWLASVARDPDRDAAFRRRAERRMAGPVGAPETAVGTAPRTAAGGAKEAADPQPKDLPAAPAGKPPALAGTATAASAAGRTAFRKLTCRNCHNIDGEGAGFAPDLVAMTEKHPDEEILAALLDPRPVLCDGYETASFDDGEGRLLRGIVESNGEGIALIDLAGNRIEGSPRRWTRQEGSEPAVWPCARLVAPLDPPALAEILAYLRSL